MPSRLSLLSLINGKIGESQTIVGIPLSRKIFNTSARLFVVHTFGSILLHKFSSKVVKVIWTMHFVFSFILFNKSKSLKIKSDFVMTVKPKPYLSINSNAFLTFPSFASNGIYGSVILPVPIIHFLRLLFKAFSNNSIALPFTSISSNRWFIW